jgi:hypothetical protein
VLSSLRVSMVVGPPPRRAGAARSTIQTRTRADGVSAATSAPGLRHSPWMWVVEAAVDELVFAGISVQLPWCVTTHDYCRVPTTIAGYTIVSETNGLIT